MAMAAVSSSERNAEAVLSKGAQEFKRVCTYFQGIMSDKPNQERSLGLTLHSVKDGQPRASLWSTNTCRPIPHNTSGAEADGRVERKKRGQSPGSKFSKALMEGSSDHH